MTFTCVVPLVPVPMARPRVTGGKFPRAYLPKKCRTFIDSCATYMGAHWRQPPMEGPVAMYVVFVHPRPLRLQRRADPPGRLWKDTRPDVDNLVKSIADSAQHPAAGILMDDSQIVLIEARDMYGEKGEKGKIEVEIMPILEEDVEID